MPALNETQVWITVISASISMLAIASGIWLSLREYRIKLRAEQRQQKSADIEAEIRLQTLFTELMAVANGRSGYEISETAAKFTLDHLPEGKMSPEQINDALESVCILTLPVGSASQDAAVAAISSLTLKYDVLCGPGC